MTQTPSSHEYKKVLQPETKKKQKQSDTGKREREVATERIYEEKLEVKETKKKNKFNFLQKSNIRMVPTETKF